MNSFSWGEAGAAETVRLSVGRETSTGDVVTVVRAIMEKMYVIYDKSTSMCLFFGCLSLFSSI